MTIENVRNFLIYLRLLGVVMLVGGVSMGCDDDKCNRQSDCGANQSCIGGNCVTHANTTDTGSGNITDSASNADSGTSVTNDTQTDTINDTSGSDRRCLGNGDCDDGNPCTKDFCDVSQNPYRCGAAPEMDGVSCEDGDPCTENDVCGNGGCIPGSPRCVSSSPPGECVTYVATCAADAADPCAYTVTAAENGTLCTLGDACSQGICRDGECVDPRNPCNENDSPCEISTCIATGSHPDEFQCERNIAPDGTACRLFKSNDMCASSNTSLDYVDGYCVSAGEGATCFPGESRICFDAALPNICTAQVCVPNDGSCTDVLPADVSIQAVCGETVTVAATRFITREYGHYSDPCAPIDVRGSEVALTVALAAPANVTVTVLDNGGQAISLHHLTDMCNPATCQSNAYTALSITGMTATDAIIVEAGIGAPPASIQLEISCN